jgi:hypothetical protein
MPESGTYGSVRGAPSNGRPYRNALPITVSQGLRKQSFISRGQSVSANRLQLSFHGCTDDDLMAVTNTSGNWGFTHKDGLSY